MKSHAVSAASIEAPLPARGVREERTFHALAPSFLGFGEALVNEPGRLPGLNTRRS